MYKEAAAKVEMAMTKLSKKKILERVGREVERASQRERRKSRATWRQVLVPHRQPFAWCNQGTDKYALGSQQPWKEARDFNVHTQ